MSLEQENGELIDLGRTGEPKPARRNHRVAKALGIFGLGAAAVIVPIGVGIYKHDYVTADNCTGLDKQAVPVVADWPSDISRRMHNLTDSFRSAAVSLNDVVEAQRQVRGYAIDTGRVAEANGISDPNQAFNVSVCLKGFGPKVTVVGGQALVEAAPVSSLWAATANTTGGDQAKLIGAAAKANADQIGQQHGFPQTGAYPFAKEFYDNILATPGMTDRAKESFRQEVAEAGLTPLG